MAFKVREIRGFRVRTWTILPFDRERLCIAWLFAVEAQLYLFVIVLSHLENPFFETRESHIDVSVQQGFQFLIKISLLEVDLVV